MMAADSMMTRRQVPDSDRTKINMYIRTLKSGGKERLDKKHSGSMARGDQKRIILLAG